MALPALTAPASLRPNRAMPGGRARTQRRGLLPAGYYHISACTRRLAQNAPGTGGVPGFKHCYLYFEGFGGSPSFTRSYGPGEMGDEHFVQAGTTDCRDVGGPEGVQMFSDQDVARIVGIWTDVVAENPAYNVLHNNCCSKVIQTLQRADLYVSPHLTSANFGNY